LDLKAQNSFIKWATEQGYSVFAVSWVNLDASYSDVGLEEFILERFISALEIAKVISGQPQINVIGYCIGGTLLALVLALLKKRGNTSIKTINFFTTLNNFPNNLNLRFFYKMFCWPN
tara:strand:+ start:99 stop:452 length:354 start_codon:yes stop_codon:yes gene_type:complete